MDKKIIESNRNAWNQAFGYHKKARNNSPQRNFADPEFTTFNKSPGDQIVLGKIKALDLKGKAVAHVQTNNGRELLSLMRVSGAEQGIGFDISDDAISEARELAEIAKVNAQFECVNIFEISEKYNNYFDFIYITEGSLSWLPNVAEYFKVMNRLLKKGGQILISEIHPVGFVFDTDPIVNYDGGQGPYKHLTSLDYVGGVEYTPDGCFWYMHTVSDIVMAVLNNGFEIHQFDESCHDTGWIDAKNNFTRFPRSFTMLCKKSC